MVYDAVIVGAGPNGLAAAIALARAGRRVLLVEANDRIGGGLASAELTLPGFVHDIGSAVHPFGVGSSFFRSLPLERFGLRWVHPAIPLAHPLDGGGAALLHRSLDATAAGLGADGRGYRALFAAATRDWEHIAADGLGPPKLPRHPLALAGFGARALWPASWVARLLFGTAPARALFGGLAAHACLPLDTPATTAVALTLGTLGHVFGWPVPQGGAQRFADALAAYFRALGGEIVVGQRVSDLATLPPRRATLLDLAPQQVLDLAGGRFPDSYRRALARFRHGPGIFKLDWALDAPIPWAAPPARLAGTVHLGGTLEELEAAERAPWLGQTHPRPYVLLAQPTIADPSRAPVGKHTAWAYCHIPRGGEQDMTAAIEAQIERFAPGFGQRIIARRATGPAALERYDANLIGGDITGGVSDLGQLLTRPVVSLDPYATPLPGLFLCSASTPPGPGVHGLCGFYAAQSVLRYLR